MAPKPYEMHSAVTVEPFTQADLREYVLESGWRLYAELWDTVDPDGLREHASRFPGLCLLEKVPEYPESVLAFAISSHRFAVVPSQGELSFLVDDPACDSTLLLAVACHFNLLLRQIWPETHSH